MKKALLVLLFLAVAGAAGGWFWYQARITQFAAEPYGAPEPRTVVVPNGTGPQRLSGLLAEAGVVRDAPLLYAYLRREKLGPKLKAGEYEFVGPLSPEAVVRKLVNGEVKVYRFTVAEGLRVDETLPLLAQSALQLDLAQLKALASDPAFAQKLGVPAATLEGYLYPDTYTFTRGATEAQVLTKMVSRAKEELAKAAAVKLPTVQLTPQQAMTLASIVEKETGVPEERPRIACVFHNRLRQKMKLQTDPTVLYAAMLLRGGVFVKNITRRDLETPHPYNTYTTYGLPPGPIASAGAAAMEAVYRPLSCQDLYFVSRNDGTHVFCPTLQCHEAAVQKWQRDFFANKRRKAQRR